MHYLNICISARSISKHWNSKLLLIQTRYLKSLGNLRFKILRRSCFGRGYSLRFTDHNVTIAKKMTACRFYRDPLRKIDFIWLKNSHKINILNIKISENKVLSTKTYADMSNFSLLVLNITYARKVSR